MRARGHNHRMPHFCRCNASFFAPPRHHGRFRGQSPFQDLIPSQQLPAVSAQEFLNPGDKVTLQFVLLLQSLLFNSFLAQRTLLPFRLVGFIAPHMDESRGEERHGFRQHIFQEAKGLFFPGAEDVSDGPDPAGSYSLVNTGAGEFRISSQRGHCMGGHLDFGNDGHIPLPGILNQCFDLFLGIKAPVGSLFSRPDQRTAVPVELFPVDTPGPHLCELRVFFDLQTPSLVIDEMPVQDIHLVHGQIIHKPVQRFNGHEVAGHIDMHSAVGKSGMVGDGYRR